MTTNYGNDVRQIMEAAIENLPWWADHNNLARMAEHLMGPVDDDQVVHMLEKPWKWDAEWAAIVKADAGWHLDQEERHG